MNRFLYLPGHSAYLAERWLEAHASGAPVTLLCAHGTDGESLMARHALVEAAYPLSAWSGEGLAGAAPRVVLPLAFDTTPLRYKPGVFLPDLTPYYPLVRRLWSLGFRGFECYGLGGSQVLPLPYLLDAFVDCHKGRRCFVAGNGPSLNDIDMTRLRDEITFGSNQCYLGYADWGFSFTYWGVSDEYQIQAYDRDYEAHVPAECVQFYPFAYWPLLRFPQACPVNRVWCREAAHQFSSDPGQVYRGYTVTYMLLQIAAVMGCDPIILIGTDHRYDLRRRYILSKGLRRFRRWATRHLRGGVVYNMTNAARLEYIKAKGRRGRAMDDPLWESGDAAAPTHFTSHYTTPEKRRFLPPEPEEAEGDFACARRWAEARGVRILNATPGTALDVFPKVAFDELFE